MITLPQPITNSFPPPPFKYTHNPADWLRMLREGVTEVFYISDLISDRYSTPGLGGQRHDREFSIRSYRDSIQLWQFDDRSEWVASITLSGAQMTRDSKRFGTFEEAYTWSIGFVWKPYCVRHQYQKSTSIQSSVNLRLSS